MKSVVEQFETGESGPDRRRPDAGEFWANAMFVASQQIVGRVDVR